MKENEEGLIQLDGCIQDRVSHESEGGHSRFASGAGEGLMESDGVADHPNPMMLV